MALCLYLHTHTARATVSLQHALQVSSKSSAGVTARINCSHPALLLKLPQEDVQTGEKYGCARSKQ